MLKYYYILFGCLHRYYFVLFYICINWCFESGTVSVYVQEQ